MSYGMSYLKEKLNNHKRRVKIRYAYYEQKATAPDLGISTPQGLEWLSTVNGWCTKAVDGLADRLQFDGFENDTFDLNGMFAYNNAEIFYDDCILSALITSCAFVLVTRAADKVLGTNDNGEELTESRVRFQVIDGAHGTGVIDDYTKLLTEGYAVLSYDNKKHKPVREAYCTPGRTEIYENGELVAVEEFPSDFCALVPIIYKPDSKRPFGHSRISRACMDYAKSAMRTVKRMEISAEFYSFPQKWVTGLDPDAEKMESWKATMSTMLSFSKDNDGGSPNVGQFQAASMSPHIEELRGIASMFAGETGLTLDDLGFVTSNPSSAEAIKAGHENMRLIASKAQRCFGVGFKNVGFLGACIRDNLSYPHEEVFKTAARWKPTFEPDVSALSGIGDFAIKLNSAVPDYITPDRLRRLTGIE